MPGMNGEVTIKAADLKNVLQVPIDAIRATNELAPVSRMFSMPVDTLTNQLRRDLVATRRQDGDSWPLRGGRSCPNNTYEMRLVKLGPTDLKVVQVIDGLKEGDKVVTLGAIIAARPDDRAEARRSRTDMQRGASRSRARYRRARSRPRRTPAATAKTAAASTSCGDG